MPSELLFITNHLRACEDCLSIVAEAARVERETDIVSQKRLNPRLRLPRLLSWAAITAVLGILLVSVSSQIVDESDQLKRLVDAMPRKHRRIEPRLTGGFPWAPMQKIANRNAESLDSQQMKVVGVAGDVLERTANDHSVAAEHAAAIAHLIAGNSTEATVLLKQIPKADARIWSDLSAACYTAAISGSDRSLLGEAPPPQNLWVEAH